MKKLSFLTLILSVLGGSAFAATISGTVMSTITSAPIASAKLYIQDSLSGLYDSTTTNSSGVYTYTVPSFVTTTRNYLYVRAMACGATSSNFWTYNGSNITGANFSLSCPAPFTLSGTVSLGSTTNNGIARLYLIRMDVDSVLLDTTLTAIDSFSTASTGGTFSRTYSTIPYTGYGLLLKAALISTHPSYSAFLPTYYSSSLNWSSATRLSSGSFSASTATNIAMKAGTNPGGPGFIGGSVLVGANKSAAVGDPLKNKILLLTDNANKPVAYTYSDATGKFSFPSLPYGTYKIFGDAPGKTNPALTVTISAARPAVSNILFEENNKTFRGTVNTLSVGTSAALSAVGVYPNPVTDHVQFSGLSAINGAKTVVLRDVTGAVISRQTIAPGAAASVATDALPAGVFLLQLSTEEGTASFRIVK